MIPTTFRYSSFRNQAVCPLPADPVSAHAPDFVAIFVHIRSILAVIRPLVWHPAEVRNINLIAGLQFYLPISLAALFSKGEWKPIEHRVSAASLRGSGRSELLPF